jgi:integrase
VTVAPELTVEAAFRIVREATKDKSYRQYPLGQAAGRYLRARRKRLAPSSYRDYESCLDKLARDFADLDVCDFEPPVGTERLEEFLDDRWGSQAARTYNKNLSIVSEFFKFQRLRGELHGDPTLPIERAKKRAVYRTTFTDDQRRAILADNPERRDRLALRLLLVYGIRKGALRRIQFRHFDHERRRLTIFTKGGKVQDVPVRSAAFWHELGILLIEDSLEPHHFLLPRQKAIPRDFDPVTRKATRMELHRFHDQPMGEHGLHDWWYRCLTQAGVVAEGTTRGERMHKARHTAGQRVLDKTGNLKAAQKLLGHASMQTTGDIYTDWDIDQLADTMDAVEEDL